MVDDPRTQTIVWSASSTPSPALRHFGLELLDAGAAAKVFDLASARCSIGSHDSNDVVIADPTVSRFHCEIRVDGSRASIRDLDSRNGTVLDGVLVREAYLRSGSVIGLGRVSLRFLPRDQTSPLAVSPKHELGGLVARSIAMRAVFAVLERVAATDATLLLEGETGTGKSKAARGVHALSARSHGPFLTLDCGALPPSLLESELFGHKKGAFTGAVEDRAGIFEDAQGGTVFLDEIGEVPLELQTKLLKAIEDREIRRVGTTSYKAIDVRVIAATNRDLRAEVNAGRFRADLYYRLAVVRATIPPLRQRPEDIPAIAERILDDLAAPADASATLRTPEFMNRLAQATWPGNVRELRNHLERCLVFRDALPPGDASEAVRPGAGAPSIAELANEPYAEARRKAIELFERQYLEALVERHGGNIAAAAEAAEMDRAYVYKLLRRHRSKS